MDSKALLAVFVCIIIGFYLKLEWLVMLLVIFLFLMVLGSAGGAAAKAPAKKPEEIIYPVIYEDVGESPFLYPPGMKIEVNPNWKPGPLWKSAADGASAIFKAGIGLARGREHEEEEEE
jgi:hypothetical protein